MQAFMREVLPEAAEPARVLAGELIGATFAAVGKQFSEQLRTSAEIDAYADAMAAMFWAYLERLREGEACGCFRGRS
jgi:hypothetical protein